MLVPTHPALLANSGFEDRSGGYTYSPPRMTSRPLEPTGGEANGGRRPSIHMRRRRCSATPVLTGRAASIPSPHSPALRGSPLHTPRRASTPLPAIASRNLKSSTSLAFSSLHPQQPSQARQARVANGAQDLSARANPGSRGPSPGTQGGPGAHEGAVGSADPIQPHRVHPPFSTEYDDPSRGSIPGTNSLGGLPDVMADPRGPHKAALTNGTNGTRPPLQPRQGGIDPSSPYHLSQLTIPSPQLSTFPARSNPPTVSPCTPVTAVYRPNGLGSALNGRGANLSSHSHSALTTLRKDLHSGPTIDDRAGRDVEPNRALSSSTLPRLPALSISLNGINGNAGRPSHHSSSRLSSDNTSSLSVDTEASGLVAGAPRQYDTTRDHLLHPATPLTARPLPHSERTPTMSHGDQTPIATVVRGSHIPMILDCPPMSPIEQLHKQAPLNWCNPRTSDLVLVVPTHTWDGKLKCVGSREGGETAFTSRDRKLPGSKGRNGKATAKMANGHHEPTPPPPPSFSDASVPSMGFAVHSDYLRLQSGLMNKVLSHTVDPSDQSLKGCCELPSLPGSPTDRAPNGSLRQVRQVLVPLPDPRSFPFLLHWLYWGDVRAFERALSSGHVNWNGVIANADFLEVDTRTKKVVAHWWRRWVQFSPEGRTHPDTYDSDEYADNEEDFESDESMAPLSEKEQQAADEMTKLLMSL